MLKQIPGLDSRREQASKGEIQLFLPQQKLILTDPGWNKYLDNYWNKNTVLIPT